MNYPKEPSKKVFIMATVCVIVAFSILWITEKNIDKESVYKPEYDRIDLDSILVKVSDVGSFEGEEVNKNNPIKLTENDYKVLFEQTGLGRSAVDYILENDKDYISSIKNRQKIFFDGYPYTCVKIGLVTYNERMRDEYGKKLKGYKLVDLRPGDVLVSLSTHTLGYRHGHCGIVVNAPKKGKEAKTLEAVYWGEPTEYQTTGKWRSCPTLVHLRISKESAESMGYTVEELGKLLAECAEKDGADVQYALLPELYNKNESDGMKRTHCSHLVWYVYNKFGFNIDSDGGAIVTPYDIAASDLFDIVQIYGVNPNFGRNTE